MRIIVATSNKYAHLMVGFAYLWNKYGGQALPVTVLHYEVAPPPLPSNFSNVQVGRQGEYSWSGGIRKYLKSIDDERVLFMLEDYWLIDHLRHGWLRFADDYMAAWPEVQKVDLCSDRQGHAHSDYSAEFIRAEHDNCLTSVMAAIWRRDFFLDCLGNHDETPWAFEVDGTHRLWQREYMILGLKTPAVLYKLAVRNGRLDNLILEDRSAAEVAELAELGFR